MRSGRVSMSIAGLALALVVGGCSVPTFGDGDETASETEQVDSEAALETTDEPDEESVRLSPSEVFDQASGAVVFISNGSFFGSGVHIGGGRILTNAHVVYPAETVRVVLPDGRELVDVAVGSVDHIYDLALVGPIDVELPSLALEPIDPPAIGAPVFAIGYPGEVEDRPTSPTLSSGALSRVRSTKVMGLDFLQVDVRIAGGQSGGALVDEQGRLVGLTGLAEFTEASFGLALAAADVSRGVDRLEAPSAENMSSMVDRAGVAKQHRVELIDQEVGAFLIESAADEVLVADVTVDGPGDSWLELNDLNASEPSPTDKALSDTRDSDFGTTSPYDFEEASDAVGESFADENLAGSERLERELQAPGFWWALVGQLSEGPNGFDVTSGVDLVPLIDDDGSVIAPGDVVEGVTDFPGDVDRFEIDLTEGQSIQISADSLGDTVLAVLDPDGELVAFDDDSTGLYGLGSVVELVAESSGRHTVELEQHNGIPAGYVIVVEAAGGGTNPAG